MKTSCHPDPPRFVAEKDLGFFASLRALRPVGPGALRMTFLALVWFSSSANALESTFSGNYLIPEHQSGFYEEDYEVQVGKKILRGLENFFLGPLEVPQGIKSEFGYRQMQQLPAGIESVFIGAFNGFFRGLGRMAVGVYEVFTFPYAQGPILPEMSEWLF